MSKRLELLSQRIKQVPPYVDSSFDYLNLSSLLTHEENVPPSSHLGSQTSRQAVRGVRNHPQHRLLRRGSQIPHFPASQTSQPQHPRLFLQTPIWKRLFDCWIWPINRLTCKRRSWSSYHGISTMGTFGLHYLSIGE